MEVFSVEG
jgi:hypothetical protein